jgi:adenine-specific DNA-methyltransferase
MFVGVTTSFHTNKTPASDRKLRGGYYTPPPLAAFLAKWAVRTPVDRILEPSCGDGAFVEPVVNRIKALRPVRSRSKAQFTAVEIIPEEIEKAQDKAESLNASAIVDLDWRELDFFKAFEALRQEPGFDVVIGNPPFIRFQHLDPESRDRAFKWLKHYGWKPTKLANVWASFVQLSLPLIRVGGRLAMVLPAELLQVTYAAELRAQLTKWFDHVVLVAFRQLVFPEIQQEVVLLLAEGKRGEPSDHSDMHVVEVGASKELLALDVIADRVAHTPARHTRVGMKWTALFLSQEHFDAIDVAQRTKGLSHLGEYASVDIGVVTGRNSFFLVKEDQRDNLKVDAFVPVVGKTSALKSVRFSKSDFTAYRKQYPANLLALGGVPKSDFSAALRRYLEEGEEHKIHIGYKCSIRARWYDVPSIYIPDGFLFRQIHTYPLLVVNEAKATSTDTIHRVRLRNGASMKQLALCSVNSLTFAWAEVCGRSYGGGVLELEPREAEELPIPYFPEAKLDAERIDLSLRSGKVEEALDYVDNELLVGRLGLDKKTVRLIRGAWKQLANRRMGRRD